MTMKYQREDRVNLGKVKEHLSRYVAKAERGTKIIICRRNRPVAEIIPIDQPPGENRTSLGCRLGSVQIRTDITEPAIPAEDWDALS